MANGLQTHETSLAMMYNPSSVVRADVNAARTDNAGEDIGQNRQSKNPVMVLAIVGTKEPMALAAIGVVEGSGLRRLKFLR